MQQQLQSLRQLQLSAGSAPAAAAPGSFLHAAESQLQRQRLQQLYLLQPVAEQVHLTCARSTVRPYWNWAATTAKS